MSVRFLTISPLAMLAVMLSAPVSAQEVPDPAATDNGGLEEIIVTAQRRTENLQDVPVAVTAVTANALENAGITNTDYLTNIVPGLTMTRQTRGSLPFVRGIGSQSSIIGNENAVATYVDGVYMVDILGSAFSFNNIDRIEVLKGPQGTLFGRNATGGLIHVVTRDPSADEGGEASLSYGNYNTVQGAFYATGGNDKLKADIAFYGIQQEDGFGRFLLTGRDANFRREASIRSKILWTPTDDDRITLAGDWGTNKSDLGQSRNIFPGSLGTGGLPFQGTIHDSSGGPTIINAVSNWGVSLRYERDLGFADLTILSAYRRNLQRADYDQDSNPLQLADVSQNQVNESLQNELYLNGKTGRLDWTAGIFLFSNKAETLRLGIRSIAPAANTDLFATQQTQSYAAYGQGTYALTDELNLTAGLRYTLDKRDLSGRRVAAPGNTVPIGTVLQTITPDAAELSFGRVTWRLAIDYELAPGIMAYASYNRGFKSGVFNMTNLFAPPVKPETLDAYEAGLKSELFDRQLRLNLSAFHYDYTNIQLTTVQAGIASFFNAATGKVDGMEVSADFAPNLPTGNLVLSAGLSVLKTKYSNFPGGPINTPNPAGGNIQTIGDLSGNEMIRSPDWTLSLGLTYSVPIGDNEAGISGNYFHSDGFYWEPDNRLRQKPYDVLNAQVYFAFGDEEQVRVRVFGDNLTNEQYFSYVAANSFGDTASAANPRTYGVGVDFKF